MSSEQSQLEVRPLDRTVKRIREKGKKMENQAQNPTKGDSNETSMFQTAPCNHLYTIPIKLTIALQHFCLDVFAVTVNAGKPSRDPFFRGERRPKAVVSRKNGVLSG